MNIKTILCPTDFSPYSEAALAYASALAAQANGLLYIVHVDESMPTYVPGYAGYGVSTTMSDSASDRRQRKLESTLPTILGVKYVHRSLRGVPEKEIVDLAEREHVDLIVMGTHGRSGLSRVLLGSVAESVVRHAHCPVLTVKGFAKHVRTQSEASAAFNHGVELQPLV
jgi:glycine betaine transporter